MARGRRRWLIWWVLLVVAGVVAAVVPLLPQSWPLVVRALLGVVGAIAAGAAGTYVSEVIAARRQAVEADRAAVAEVATRRDDLRETREVGASDQQSVAGLLRPERAVVDFVGRVDELERLRSWCVDETACPVWLVTGPGGVGKTRLGLRLAESLPFEEWECQSVRPGDEVAAVKAAGLVGQRVLLLVDYAETRPGLAAMLTQVAAGDAGGPRVLLLARQAGEWWTSLDTESDATRELVSRTPVLELAAALDDRRDDVQVIEEALPFYAAARGRPVPQVSFTIESPERLPVLVLHAAALVAVLDDEQGTSGGRAAADLGVLDRLLGHERRLWDKVARRAGLTVRLPVLEQVVAAVSLVLYPQDAGEEPVRAAIRLVPDLARADEERVGAVAGWLRQLYPAQGGQVDVLRPDLLAERHAVDQLAAHELLRRACFVDLTPEQAVHGLVLLTRACAHHPDAAGLIGEVLRQNLVDLAVAAMVVAVQTGPGFGDLLVSVLKDAPISVTDLQRIAEQIPYPMMALAAVGVVVNRRGREQLPPDADPADIAHWSAQLSVFLIQMGQREEALEAVTEAVTAYRRLAADDPDSFLPDLALSLNNQSGCLAELGRREEALEAVTEAVTTYRRLAADGPDDLLPKLAMSLSNHAACLADLGRQEEALEAANEAVQIRRRLVGDRLDVHLLSDLAMSLSNQAVHFAQLGRLEEGLAAATEAVAAYWRLAADRPEAFIPLLASSLINEASALMRLGSWEEGLLAATTGVMAFRGLVADHPDAFLPDLALSLHAQADCLEELGRREEALKAATEAVVAYRRLAAGRPGVFLADLASSLNSQSISLAKSAGREEEALEAATEAVRINRALVVDRPDVFSPKLAKSLINQSIRLLVLRRWREGRQAAAEAVAICRRLVADRPDPHEIELASALHNLAIHLGRPGHWQEALDAINEALRIRRQLADARPEVHNAELEKAQAVKDWLEEKVAQGF